jgi:hypothetical protein
VEAIPVKEVQSLEDQIYPFITIMPGEATKGSGPLDEILTYRYIKPWI